MKQRGFTFVELLVVLAILALLAGGAASVGELVNRRERERELKLALREIRSAIDAHKALADAGRIRKGAGESGYPRELSDLSDGVIDVTSPRGQRIYLLRRLPRDPFADPTLPAVATWGQRAYDSPPDRPAAGRDWFDVYSRADGRGLDGRPYREW